ncbi:MAG TPA: hypothetical protein PJ991_01625 [Kiritimatiellia bacterium]|nr:hypothetical protein [Kiritimatiellia bacterium]
MKRMILSTFFIACLLISRQDAEGLEFSHILSTNRIHVGDRVELRITAEHQADERLLFPSLQRQPYIVAWDSSLTHRNTSDGRRETTARFVFSSFAPGEHRISTNTITHLKADGTEETIPFPVVLLNVTTILTNPPPALADIKEPATIPGNQWLRFLWIMLAIVLLAVLAALAIRYWLRRPVKEKIIPALPPDHIAMTALNALKQRQLIEKGETELFYVELSDIVRLYLEQRFDLHAPEQTTEEFIRSSSQSNVLSPDHRLLAQGFLEHSDLVKFALHRPGPVDMNSAWESAVKLVRETSGGAPS